MPLSKQRKGEYFGKMEALLDSYTKVFVVSVDNVGSSQMQKTRLSMRGKAEVLMGKNTLMRKVLKSYIEKKPDHPMAALEPLIRGNVGFVFTNGDLTEIRDKILENKIPAPARAGAVSPCIVIIPPGPTGCDPGQTSFFQALQVGTKIVKGQIEITSPFTVLKQGDKVGPSEAALLQKLNIRPFSYGLIISSIYDNGSVFAPRVLDITPEVLGSYFGAAMAKVAALSLAIGYPTQASLPHSMAAAFKTVVAVVVGLDTYSFAKAEAFKAYAKDPSAFASSSAPAAGGAAPVAAAAVKEVEKEEEVDMGGAMDMFGGGGAAKTGNY